MVDAFFPRLAWSDDRVVIDDLVFMFERSLPSGAGPDEHSFRLHKGRALVDQYERFWARRPDFRPRSILELGMWDGGSIAFWNECFHPATHVGVDIDTRGDSVYFEEFLRTRPEGSVKTFWGVDQGDATTLRRMVDREFPDGLDLVIDDASHLYRLTKSSFETIFPLLRPGALYVIEDWAWAHWAVSQQPREASRDPGLTKLVDELTHAVGSSTTLVASSTIYQGFAVIERGEQHLDREGFHLDDHIVRRSAASRARTEIERAAKKAKRVLRNLR